MPSLFVVRGRDQGKHFQLSKPMYRIGRETGSDIQLLDSESSRSHAEFQAGDDGKYEIVDLGSSNGTRINGKRVSRHLLNSGDRIEIGGTLMIYTGTGQPGATSAGRGSSSIGPIGDLEAAHGVDIVLKSQDDVSRIVSSLSQSVSDPDLIVNSGEGSLRRRSESDRSLEVMYLTAIAVGRTDDIEEVLNRILRLVFDWVEADRGCVMLRDVATDKFRPAARCDREDEANSVRGKPIAISQTILDYVIKQKEGVRTSDARDDARFDSAASIVQGGVREALCVPLQGRYAIVGALYIDTYTSPGQFVASGNKTRFNDDHLRLITAIGHQAALAIEDTFYYSALVQSERLAAMGQTIATLSHHIKNILQGISGGSYLIEAGLDRGDTDAVRRGWSIVDRNQERISNLVMDMLTFSKEREPEKVDADLNETVADAVELMKARAAEVQVEIGTDLTSSMPLALFDPDAVHRAVMNLVTNAIDAASGRLARDDDFDVNAELGDPAESEAETGKVFVRTSYESGQGWTVDVVDNGLGVAPEDREKIFSLFESRKGMRGTGLGLPVSAKIMREHGGDISIVDIGISQGTCFRLRFPDRETNLSDFAKLDTLG
ncbi:ATP-binding protein [Rubripirellula reticaptiva]|uniref:histidine kinase n=1 Tax=Rubripirellula reticaptiva TaxID=2528013 RepID=A0A5C6EJG5_9BACT|nr:ATP-binding protein [Rubripirellula reticaptiva]TWU48237.1 Blue-light-activated protein [Rubripirellula reticaptiva]